MKLKNWIILLFLTFTIVYAIKGDSENKHWSFAYFIATNSLLLVVMWDYPVKLIRIFASALFITVLLYLVIRYVFDVNIDRIYNLIPFTIGASGLFVISIINEYKRTRH